MSINAVMVLSSQFQLYCAMLQDYGKSLYPNKESFLDEKCTKTEIQKLADISNTINLYQDRDVLFCYQPKVRLRKKNYGPYF